MHLKAKGGPATLPVD